MSGKNAEKKARSFDLSEMLSVTTATAQERSRDTLEARAQEEASSSSVSSLAGAALPTAKPKPSSSSAGGDDDSDDDVGPALPPGFKVPGAPAAEASEAAGPSSGAGASGAGEEEEGEEEEWVEGEEVSVEKLIPASSEIQMSHGKRGITALSFDVQGARVISGCLAGDVKMWDFAGMDSGFKSFRQVRPYDNHVLKGLAYSLNGEKILVTGAHCQAKLLERNGKEWGECIKGDNYLHDAKKTKGHTAALTGGSWHPWSREEFLTSSDDGTVRLWSLQDFKVVTKLINTQRAVIRTKTSGGMKIPVGAAAYSKDGKLVAAGCQDGSIQMWKHGGQYVSHAHINRVAHQKGSDITSLSFSYDSQMLLSRATDDSMKLWDLRSFKKPVLVAEGLENAWGMTDCGWSPRNELCFTGTSVKKGTGGSGSLVFLNRVDFSPVYRMEYPDESVVRCQWHPKINQLVAGLSGGEVKLYYDPERSARGALMCLTKPAKRERRQEIIKEEIILAPLGEKLFEARNEDEDEKEVTPWRVKKFLRMKQRDPNLKYPKPEEPFTGPGAQGKLTAAGSTLHSWFAQQLGVMRNKELLETNEDVRASILRHDEDAKEKSLYLGNLYKRTQPTPIFQDSTEDPAEAPAAEDQPLQPHFKKPKL